MYKEKIANNANRVLVFIFTVVGILLVVSLYQYIKIEKYNLLIDLFLISILSAGCFVLLKYFLTDYTYTIVGKEIIFNKSYGNRERGVMSVSFSHIEVVMPFDNKRIGKYKKIKKTNKFIINGIKQKKYCIIYRVGNTLEKVVFQPSDDLKHVLKKAMEEKVYE